MPAASVPVVLVLAGNDPSGGAGLQADIEALASMGCHAAPVVTALTVQDTRDVQAVYPVEPARVVEQARAVLEDLPVGAVKIGLLGTAANAAAVHSLLTDYPRLPVVLDPVLRAGGGRALADAELVESLRTLLLPQTTVLTPNGPEARLLAPDADGPEAAAHALVEAGCEFVLLTGGHETAIPGPGPEGRRTAQVVNRLYAQEGGAPRLVESYAWERLPGEHHGSGCTLASALAGLLAQGEDPRSAARQAQEYTWETLRRAYRVGMGQLIPNRLYWAHCGEEPQRLRQAPGD
ncbi:MAG: hydroxymethylpyrimidine/phosphomethylpyrimidine kinase [Gammaproteobacteria bacterium]|nr:MAG: hydroxymethylpyrimidine/phosphomethylpyrimidine kinase [Gammaproteobacteria bacterium]